MVMGSNHAPFAVNRTLESQSLTTSCVYTIKNLHSTSALLSRCWLKRTSSLCISFGNHIIVCYMHLCPTQGYEYSVIIIVWSVSVKSTLEHLFFLKMPSRTQQATEAKYLWGFLSFKSIAEPISLAIYGAKPHPNRTRKRGLVTSL